MVLATKERFGRGDGECNWHAVQVLLSNKTRQQHSRNARREEDHTEPDEEEWYDTHRLVHLATRIWFNKNDNSSKVVKDAIRHVAHVFPFTAYDRELIIWRAYLPHSLRLLNGGQHCNKSDISELCLRVGICLGKNGRLRESLVWVEKACQQRDHLSEDDPERLASQYHLAIIYTLDRQMENSILLLERIVQVRMKTPYSERPSLLASLDAPARAYALNGQGHKAREILERVVEAEEKTLPPENYQLLLLQQTLARAYEACNQMHKAVPLHEKVVRTREKILAPGHPDILHAQHTLARSYLLAGQEQRAVPLLEQVIDARDTTLSSEHPNVGMSHQILAIGYYKLGQLDRAVALLKSIVAGEARMLRDDHPSWRETIELLNFMLARLDGNEDEALEPNEEGYWDFVPSKPAA